MKFQIISTLFAGLLFSGLQVSAQENVFLNRDYWKANPSLEHVKKDVAQGNDPAELNAFAFDALVYALLEKADDSVLKYLLSAEGNSITKKTHDSRIYLHWAAYAGKTAFTEFLLQKGSDVTDFDSHGYTPLTFAANAGQKDKELYEVFEKHGVDLVKEENENGANVLLLVAPFLSNEKELDYYLDKGLAFNSTDNVGNGIFNYAAKKGNIPFLKLLIDKGVDYKTLNNEGGNAFLFAAQGTRGHSNSIELYEYLQHLGLEPNIVTQEGYTPLHHLAYGNTKPEIFEFFLSAGADVHQKDGNGNTPFLNATSRNKLGMVELLFPRVRDLNLTNEKGQTALMLAVQNNSPEVVDFLLKKGAALQQKDAEGNNLAFYLINGYMEKESAAFDQKWKMLNEAGLKIDAVQSHNETVWHLAVKRNNLPLLKQIASLDVPLNTKNAEGMTPLHLAAMKATDTEILRFLIEHGADKNARTDFDESVYDLASENEILQKQSSELNFLQ